MTDHLRIGYVYSNHEIQQEDKLGHEFLQVIQLKDIIYHRHNDTTVKK